MENFMTGCLWYGLIIFLGYGAVFSDGDMGGRISAGACALLLIFATMQFRGGKHGKIDVSVKNKIIGHDGQGKFLVRAKTSRQIIGPRPYVDGNLPAHLTKIARDTWVVNNGAYDADVKNIDWKPVEGNWHIEPRGNSPTPGALYDQVMGGWEHNYIQKDEQE